MDNTVTTMATTMRASPRLTQRRSEDKSLTKCKTEAPELRRLKERGATEDVTAHLIRNYAAESLKKITGKEAKDLGSAPELYYDLALAYFHGDNKVVDYIYEPVYDEPVYRALDPYRDLSLPGVFRE